MCPASTAVVLGHRCHLLQQPASHYSHSHTTCPLVNSTTLEANTSNPQFCYLFGLVIPPPALSALQKITFIRIKEAKVFTTVALKIKDKTKKKRERNVIQSYWLCDIAMALPSTDSASSAKLKHCWLVGW